MSIIVEVETKIDSEPCVVDWNSNRLFVGTDTGSILSFNENLSPATSWKAHEVQVFAVAAAEDKIYTSSYDGGAKVWNWKGDKIADLPATESDIASIRVHGKYVYVGDELGNILVFEDKTVKGQYSVLEEVKSLVIKPPYMFTARDLYVTVTEITPDESKHRFTTQHTMEGRAPLCATGSYLLVTGRGGNNLQLHEISIENKFKKLHEVKVSDMIVTCLTSHGDSCWTGGWDGCVRRWKISENQLHSAGEINVGACINGLVASSSNTVYAIITGGKIVLIKGN